MPSDEADHEALDGLVGRDRRRQPVAAEQAAAEVGEDVGGPGAEQHREQQVEAEVSLAPVEPAQQRRGRPCRSRPRARRTSSPRASRAPTRASETRGDHEERDREHRREHAPRASSRCRLPGRDAPRPSRRRTRISGIGRSARAMRKNSCSAERRRDAAPAASMATPPNHAARERDRREERGDAHPPEESRSSRRRSGGAAARVLGERRAQRALRRSRARAWAENTYSL